jgi:hypothetical protein
LALPEGIDDGLAPADESRGRQHQTNHTIQPLGYSTLKVPG